MLNRIHFYDTSFFLQLKLQCSTRRNAPQAMARGAAVTDSNSNMFFIPFDSQTVYCYHLQLYRDQWNELPPCPYRNPGLSVINSLTVVGGKKGRNHYTNTLFSWDGKEWKANAFPPMNTARSQPAVVTDGNHVVVAGGCVGGNFETWTTAVEILTLDSHTWTTVKSLPQPFPSITATLCGDHVYVMDWNGSMYRSSLFSLATSVHPKTGATDEETVETDHKVWHTAPNAPQRESTLANLNGRLVSIGGVTGITISNAIHQLQGSRWVNVGFMSVARSECLVAAPEEDIVIVGGFEPTNYGFPTIAVEFGKSVSV